MTREEYLKFLIESKYKSVRAFSIQADIPYTTVRTILENGVGNARVDNIIKICSFLGISPEQLSSDFKVNETVADIMSLSIQLKSIRQKKVYDFAETQLEEQNKVVEFPKQIINGRSTAAGQPIDGAAEDSCSTTMIIDQRDIPKGADEIVTIAGDSMEPVYEEGSQVFIHWQPEVEQGEIALVSVEGFVTCKKVYVDWENDEVVLHSINEAYEDLIYPIEDVRVIGKVL